MSHTFTTWTGTPNDAVVAKNVTRPPLTGHQVFVKTTHSGVCGTDIHYHHGGIGMGHEGAGVITQVGPEVTNHKVGDRVAWGWVSFRSFSWAGVKYTNICFQRCTGHAASVPPVRPAI
jgi:D-arabinose 1-dehydrogenase-like Zn-dependent alcohol dehydrogenase